MNTTSSPEEVTTWTTKQVVLATVFVVCVFSAFWLIYRLRGVVFLFFAAMMLGTAIRPAVEWLRRRGIARRNGIILVYVVIALVLTGLLALTLPVIADQATELSGTLPEYYRNFREMLMNSGNSLLRNIGWRLPALVSTISNSDPQTTEETFDRVSQTFFYTGMVLRALLSILATFLLAYYWAQEGNLILRAVLRLLPPSRRSEIREFFDLAEAKIGGYIRGQAILSLTVGGAAFVAYTLIGLPYALVLAIFTGLMEMVPIFGPVLGAIPAILAALSVDSGKVVWVLVATGVIQLLENAWLVPRIMNSSMGVNSIIILLSLVAFSSVFGFPGALLALPLAALIQLIVDRLLRASDENRNRVESRDIVLRSLMDDNQTLLQLIHAGRGNGRAVPREIPEALRGEIDTIAQELDGLLTSLEKEKEST